MNTAPKPPLSRAEWRLAGTQRALVYRWLATLYAAEVPAPMLESYLANAAGPLFDGFAAMGLQAETKRMQAAIDSLRRVPLARLELAADFAQLFLLDAASGALPYASAHEGGSARLCGTAETRMRSTLADHGLSIDARFREPADHLAVSLALFAHLLEEQGGTDDPAAAASEQAGFVQEHLLCWLPRFCARCEQDGTQFDFYPALAALMLAFMREDLRFLLDGAVSKAGQALRPGPGEATR